jgi:hypothetical protein
LGLYVDDVAGKYKSFEPYLAKVDQICDEVAQIEETVMLLDDYTIRLVMIEKDNYCQFFYFISFLKRRQNLLQALQRNRQLLLLQAPKNKTFGVVVLFKLQC